MREVDFSLEGYELDWNLAADIATLIARRENPDTMMIARCNRLTNSCSPCSLSGDLGGRPGWEVYGETHGGRLKITVNQGVFVFIFT